jgi:hypothetical protein
VYDTQAFATAHVLKLRETFCIGYLTSPNGVKAAAVWLLKDGSRVGGPAHEDLVRLVRATAPRVAKTE